MMYRASWRCMVFCLAALVGACQACLAEVKFDIAPDHEDGVYQPGQAVVWTIKATDGDQALAGDVEWSVKRGGLATIASGAATLVDGQAQVTASRDDAGALLLNVRYKPQPDQVVSGWGGAVYAPDQIQPSAPAPDDFDAFWAAKLEALAAVPVDAQLTPVDVGIPEIDYFKITMNGYNGTKIWGQLAKPKGKTGLPAYLQVQWAGVYGLNRDWVTGPAKDGWLALNIMAHDLPIDESADFYKQKDQNELNDYPGIGREDRETSYFLRMYLAVYRAVDYLTKHPDYDGKGVTVSGSSQGGGQSLVAAGIHPAVKAIMANVPAMCDHTGLLVGRAPGWPRLTGWGEKPDSEAALAASRYFDAVNFARRSHVQYSLVGVGLIDTTCPPEGVIAAYNVLPGAKRLVIMPKVGHVGYQEAYYKEFGGWMWKLRTGVAPLP